MYPRQIGRTVGVSISGNEPEDSFMIEIEAGTILYTKDLAVLQIIKDNYGKRPIYFAVTTPTAVGFENHLRNEGMVDRVVSSAGGNQFDIDRLITNIDSVYSYRGIFDDTIYKDENMLRLLNNYGAAYMNASRYYHSNNQFSKALKYLERTLQFAPNNKGIRTALAQLYSEAGYLLLEKGFNEEAFKHLENSIYYNKTDGRQIEMVMNATIYSKEYDLGLELLKKMSDFQSKITIDEAINEILLLKNAEK